MDQQVLRAGWYIHQRSDDAQMSNLTYPYFSNYYFFSPPLNRKSLPSPMLLDGGVSMEDIKEIFQLIETGKSNQSINQVLPLSQFYVFGLHALR